MGIYDRDYERDDYGGSYGGGSYGGSYGQPPGYRIGGGPQMMVTRLVLFTVGLYVVDLLLPRGPGGLSMLTEWAGLHPDVVRQPWKIYQFLTYGFVHDTNNIMHIAMNMLILWFLGRDVEQIYGPKTFLQLYLSTIFLCGVGWFALESLIHLQTGGQPAVLVGASGGVTAMALVSILHFPHRTVLFMFLIPMPIWLLAVFYIGGDIVNAFQRNDGVASSAHLIGAALGYQFYHTKWHLGRLAAPWSGRFSLDFLKRKPKLRVHAPDDADRSDTLNQEVDRILAKISQEGEASLTRKERRTLEDASRRYQKRNE